MATEKVQILIDAKNNASRELGQVTNDLNKLNQTGLRMTSITKGLGIIGAVVGSAATLGVLARTSVELAKVAGEYTTLKNSFDDLAAGVGASSDDMLLSLRNASQGMISDMSLVQSANRALLLGVADTSAEMSQLLQVALVRGQAMGLSAEQAFNDIVTGIGRMSPLILDNLGIVTGGEKVYEDFAASIGKAADELTDAEKKQALLNSVIASSEGIVNSATASATSGFQQLQASIDNAKVSLGLLFSDDFNIGASRVAETLDTLISKFLEFDQMLKDDYAQANLNNLGATENHLESIMNLIDDNRAILDDLSNQLIDAAVAGEGEKFAGLKERIDGVSLSLRGLGERYNEMASELGKQGLNLEALAAGQIYFQDIEKAAGSVAETLDDVNEATGNAKQILSDMIPISEGTSGGLDLVAIALDHLAANAAAAKVDMGELLRSMVGVQAQAINFAGAVGAAFDTMSEVAGMRSGAKFGGLSDLIKTPMAMGDGMKAIALEAGPAASGVGKVNQALEDLKSTVSGIVSGAIGPVAGVDANDLLNKMGMRPDAVNENARRLADIAVNGFKGQDWLDEFKAQVPDVYQALVESGDPKMAAATMLKDFQDGLINGTGVLIDKERAKDLVRRALLGQSNTQALIDEIARELAAETGTAFSTVQREAQQLLGGGIGADSGMGGTFNTGMVDGVKNSSLGADLSGAVYGQVMASITLFEQTGKEAGSGFVRGFTATFDNIPASFIAAVVSLAMPGIMSNINSNGGRTGAAGT